MIDVIIDLSKINPSKRVNEITKEERQKRLSLIIEKHKLILDKIKKDNISRSSISSGSNKDSDNQTREKINK